MRFYRRLCTQRNTKCTSTTTHAQVSCVKHLHLHLHLHLFYAQSRTPPTHGLPASSCRRLQSLQSKLMTPCCADCPKLLTGDCGGIGSGVGVGCAVCGAGAGGGGVGSAVGCSVCRSWGVLYQVFFHQPKQVTRQCGGPQKATHSWVMVGGIWNAGHRGSVGYRGARIRLEPWLRMMVLSDRFRLLTAVFCRGMDFCSRASYSTDAKLKSATQPQDLEDTR